MWFQRSILLRYSAVVLSTGVAFGVTSVLRQHHIPGLYPWFFAVVVLDSWIAGFGGALLSTFLSTLAICWFLPLVKASGFDPSAIMSLGMFIVAALFVSAVSTKVMSVNSVLSAALT